MCLFKVSLFSLALKLSWNVSFSSFLLTHLTTVNHTNRTLLRQIYKLSLDDSKMFPPSGNLLWFSKQTRSLIPLHCTAFHSYYHPWLCTFCYKYVPHIPGFHHQLLVLDGGFGDKLWFMTHQRPSPTLQPQDVIGGPSFLRPLRLFHKLLFVLEFSPRFWLRPPLKSFPLLSPISVTYVSVFLFPSY